MNNINRYFVRIAYVTSTRNAHERRNLRSRYCDLCYFCVAQVGMKTVIFLIILNLPLGWFERKPQIIDFTLHVRTYFWFLPYNVSTMLHVIINLKDRYFLHGLQAYFREKNISRICFILLWYYIKLAISTFLRQISLTFVLPWLCIYTT